MRRWWLGTAMVLVGSLLLTGAAAAAHQPTRTRAALALPDVRPGRIPVTTSDELYGEWRGIGAAATLRFRPPGRYLELGPDHRVAGSFTVSFAGRFAPSYSGGANVLGGAERLELTRTRVLVAVDATGRDVGRFRRLSTRVPATARRRAVTSLAQLQGRWRPVRLVGVRRAIPAGADADLLVQGDALTMGDGGCHTYTAALVRLRPVGLSPLAGCPGGVPTPYAVSRLSRAQLDGLGRLVMRDRGGRPLGLFDPVVDLALPRGGMPVTAPWQVVGTWRPVTLRHHRVRGAVRDLVLEPGEVVVGGGCVSNRTAYSLDEGHLHLGTPVTYGCDLRPPSPLLAVLAESTAFGLGRGGRLLAIDATGGELATFERVRPGHPVQSRQLARSSWRADGSTLSFGRYSPAGGGVLVVHDGCRALRARWDVLPDGTFTTESPLATGCPTDAPDAHPLAAAVASATGIRLDTLGRLILLALDDGDATVLTRASG